MCSRCFLEVGVEFLDEDGFGLQGLVSMALFKAELCLCENVLVCLRRRVRLW